MRSKWLGRWAFTALIMGVMGAAGCAEERDPISRVQGGAVPKAFFLGADLEGFKDDPEFRTKSFNIDSAANTDNYAGTVGGASAVDRVRWEVTENWLFARRSYQESPNADNRGLPRKEVSPGKFEFPTAPTGTIIAAYRIQSHFDIRRGYNPATGEEQNTIDENVSDRPWQKREYMRIDWSQNMANSTSGDTSWVFGAGSIATAVEYSATNESNAEDRPNFEMKDGYFDITNKFQLQSDALPGFGIPECVLVGYFNGTTSFDCTPTEVKVRSSFVKLTGQEDFESFEESRAQRDIVGNWGNAGNSFNREYGGPPITAWDPQYGYTDAKTKAFYSLHNIWEKSHQNVACTSNLDDDKDGTADACANETTRYTGAAGSQCDVEVNKCTLPVRDRQLKTVGYWLNVDAPVELTDQVADDKKTITEPGALEEMTITWNQLMRNAVAARREVECRRTHDGSREECHDQFFEGSAAADKEMVKFGGWGIDKAKDQPVDKGAPVIATCHNPVRAYDLPMCGKPNEVVRLGDLRKNYAIYWPYASRAPYGGVASIGGDPLTGEMLGSTATTMMRSATAAAAQTRDIIQIALGDLKMEDLITGVQATRYADSLKQGKVTDGLAKGKTPAELAQLVKNIDQAAIQTAVGESPAQLNAMTPAARQLKAAMTRAQSSPQTKLTAAADERLSSMISKVDPALMKETTLNQGLHNLVAQAERNGTNKGSVYEALGTFAKKDSGKIQDLMDQYQAFLGSKGICFHDSQAQAGAGSIYLPSLAGYFKKLYGSLDAKERGEKIYRDLLREETKGISFHEFGHALGMRHNFASSWDSMNYQPQYWQLRTNEGQSTAACTAPRAGGADTCMGPRYSDPLTDDEQGVAGESRPGIDYWANTSTMEYHIERFGETTGAGTYDLHFMKTIYGRTLETFDSKQVKPEDQQYFAVKMLSQGISRDLVFVPSKGYGVHYSRASLQAKVFDAARDCRPATEEEKVQAKWRIVHGKVCAPSPKNHVAYEDMKSSEISFKIGTQTTSIGASGVRWSGLDENSQRAVRWPYRYGEDYSRGGYIHAKPGDAGADVYEITMNAIRRFDNTYPWSYFRRQNKEFSWWSLPNGVANSTFARMRGYHWSTTTDIGRSTAGDLTDDDQDLPAVLASAEMFNFLQRVILTPEPGAYGSGADSLKRTPTRAGAQPIFDLVTASEAAGLGGSIGTLGIIDGRFVQTDFDNDRGGSWDYFHFPNYASFDEEKVLALRELVDSRPTLSSISRENALDGRDPYISFRTDTPHAIDRLLGGLLSEDWEAISPSMNADGQTTTGFSLLDKNPANLVRPADSKGILFPNIGYSNELGAGIYALIFSRFSTDMVLAQKMRIRLEGDNAPVIPEDRKAAFTDPITGHRYMANKFGTEVIHGRAVETGIASRMIQHANELLADAYEVKPTPPNAYGEREVLLSGGLPIVKAPEAEKNLRRYIGMLDGMRQVGNIFGGGPLGGGHGD